MKLGAKRLGKTGRRAQDPEREGRIYKEYPTRVGLWPRKIPLVDELPNRPPVHPGEPRKRANCDGDSCTRLIEY